MTPFDTGLLALAATLLLIMAGMVVPVALMLCAWLGVWAIKGSAGLATTLVAHTVGEAISSHLFGVVPLFVLMGLVVADSGMAEDAYEVARACTRRMAGGLGVATVAANALFAAITGISIASAAIFAKVAVPPMLADGHTVRFATGVVAGSSVLGMLIPPSLLLILYAVLAEQSVGDLFVAGILPGLTLAALFATGIVLAAHLAPGLLWRDGAATRADLAAGCARGSPFALALNAAPIVCLTVMVIGGMQVGWFAPVEAGAVGSMAAIAFGVLRKRIGLRGLGRALVQTGLVTASVCLLIVAARTYARMLAFSGVPAELTALATEADVGYWWLMLGYVAALVVLGTLLDSASILMVAVPISLPMVVALGLDPVWFGIVTVMAVEIGLLTPPLGLSVHAIASALDERSVRSREIFLGAMPFAVAMLAVVVLLLRFPGLATGLLGTR